MAYKYRSWNANDVVTVNDLNAVHGDVEWSLEFCQTALAAKHFVRLACCDEKVVAFIMANLTADTADIYDLVVAPLHREHGVALNLLEQCISQARINNCQAIQLECRKSNIAAQHLYLKQGFCLYSEVENFYRAPPEDALVLRVNL